MNRERLGNRLMGAAGESSMIAFSEASGRGAVAGRHASAQERQILANEKTKKLKGIGR
jgi:hypothetical protein